MRNNDISLRKCSGSSADLRTSEGTLVARESARFHNSDFITAPGNLRDLITATVNLNRKLGYISSIRKLKFFKNTYRRKHSFIFPMSEKERMFFVKRQLQTTKWKNIEIYCKTNIYIL